MEFLYLLIALTMIVGVGLAPALRRRRQQQAFRRAAEQADLLTARPTVSFAKDGDPAAAASGPAAASGLVPVDRLDVRLPGPDEELVAALEEMRASSGWQPAGRLLALTDAPELRWQRVQSLAGAAAMELAQWRAAGADAAADVPDAGWLRAWRTEEPGDAGGAQVYAQFLVWQALSDPGSAEHRIILEEARTVCAEAARLAPEDVVAHITMLFVARGLNYRTPDFEAVWTEVLRRDRGHMGAHLAALGYWSAAWHGSKAEADDFARRAAASAPPRSLLAALPLFAVYDHLPDVQLTTSLYEGKVISDAIEGARFALHQAPADHPVAPHVRHLLLCFLVRAGRLAEAAEQVWAVDGYVGALPWVNSADPAHAYAEYRALAIGHA